MYAQPCYTQWQDVMDVIDMCDFDNFDSTPTLKSNSRNFFRSFRHNCKICNEHKQKKVTKDAQEIDLTAEKMGLGHIIDEHKVLESRTSHMHDEHNKRLFARYKEEKRAKIISNVEESDDESIESIKSLEDDIFVPKLFARFKEQRKMRHGNGVPDDYSSDDLSNDEVMDVDHEHFHILKVPNRKKEKQGLYDGQNSESDDLDQHAGL